jgi:NTE family protein
MLKELEQLGFPRPSFVAGASMGAIIGAMYANGWDAQRLEHYARAFNLRDHVDNPAFRLPDVALSRIVQAGSAIGSIISGRSIDSGSKARAEFFRLFGTIRIEELPIPFACTATDLISGRVVIQDSGSLVDALRASMSFPGVFAPVHRDGMLLVDGGVLNNLPCDVAHARGFKHILALDVSPFEKARTESLSNSLSVLYRCFDTASARAQDAAVSYASLVITAFDGRTPFQFEGAASTIALGGRAVQAASAQVDNFFKPGPSGVVSRIAARLGWKRKSSR